MTSNDYFGLYAYAQPDYSDDGLGWVRLSVGGLLERAAAESKSQSVSKSVKFAPVKALNHTKKTIRK